MSTHKHIDRICCVVLVIAMLVTVLFMFCEAVGIEKINLNLGYTTRLFSTEKVHEINIVMEDWEAFLEVCSDEEYTVCSVEIDGERYNNVAIRAKGNTSLSQVKSFGNNRYSFKIEFDHYDSTNSYYGLDKISLNNIIQDNTYMKDYITYRMMAELGADAPLCSYANITVNGEAWGLYLAVESVEESFLLRNYGSDYGALYKPDSQSMGGGRGNGKRFNMDDLQAEEFSGDTGSKRHWSNDEEISDNAIKPREEKAISQPDADSETTPDTDGSTSDSTSGSPLKSEFGVNKSSNSDAENSFPRGNKAQGDKIGVSDNGVALIYTDDDFSSYAEIFNNAKVDVSDIDKERFIASLKQLNEGKSIDEAVNTDEVIRYFVVHNFVCNFDSYTGSMLHNYYIYEENGQLSMIPWDYNLAFGGFMGAQSATELVNYPIDSPVSDGDVDSRPMLAWIFSDEEYTERYHDIFEEFTVGYFDSGKFDVEFYKTRDMIAPYVKNDVTAFCTYEEFINGTDTLYEFCTRRTESVKGQLNGTIASTADGQAENSDALIDASDISIASMGAMNGGNGDKQGAFSNSQGVSNTENSTYRNTSDRLWENQNGDSAQSDGNSVEPPEGVTQDGQPPQPPDGQSQSEQPPQPPDGQSQGEQPPQPPTGDFGLSGEIRGIPPGGLEGGFMPSDSAMGELSAQNGSSDITGSNAQNNAYIILTAVSVAVLAAAILFVALYKRKR